MAFLVLQTADGKSGMIVISLDDDDVQSTLDDPSAAYHHIRLSEHFPDAEDLLHEHVLLTTAPDCGSEDELNDIIENRLEIDRVIENVQICVLTPEIIQKLRAKPAESHIFSLGAGMPLVVVLLGGQDGLDRWMAENWVGERRSNQPRFPVGGFRSLTNQTIRVNEV